MQQVSGIVGHYLQRGLLRKTFFAFMGTSGGWSSIQELKLFRHAGTDIEPLSSLIIQTENLRTLTLRMTGDEAVSFVETLARTKVQSLKIRFDLPGSRSSLLNGGRPVATALERCNNITKLYLQFPSYVDQMQLFQILLAESIPKMLGLKKIKLQIKNHADHEFFDRMEQCIGGHQGEIEELTLEFDALGFHASSVNLSIVGLAPALRRLKVIRLYCVYAPLTSQQISELLGIVADCDTVLLKNLTTTSLHV